ncbi:MAG: DUF1109 family protein [Bdellovibrionales bacterium]|nr:DUF1109 family protein [Bdellovibrionales bacterium]
MSSISTSELTDRLVDDLEPVKPIPTALKLWAAWLVSAALVLLLSSLKSKIRPDLAAVAAEPGFLIQSAAIIAACASIAAMAVGLCIPGSRNSLSLWTVIVGIGAWIAAAGYEVFSHLQNGASILAGYRPIYMCSTAVLIYSIIPAAVFLFIVRLSSPLQSKRAAFLALFASGLVGTAALQISCANDNILHLLLSHWLPAVALGVLGLFLGQFLFDWDTKVNRLKERLSIKK